MILQYCELFLKYHGFIDREDYLVDVTLAQVLDEDALEPIDVLWVTTLNGDFYTLPLT